MSVSPSGTPFVYLYGECQTEDVRDFQRHERFLKCLKENSTAENNTKILNCEFRVLTYVKMFFNIRRSIIFSKILKGRRSGIFLELSLEIHILFPK